MNSRPRRRFNNLSKKTHHHWQLKGSASLKLEPVTAVHFASDDVEVARVKRRTKNAAKDTG
jgi:hypothetical protein